MKQKFIEWFTKNNNGCSPAMEDDRSFVYEMTQHMFEAYQAGVAEGEARCAALAGEVYDLKHPGTYLPSKRETPATDAFLAEVRAAAVDEVCLKISNAIVNCYQDEQVGLDAAATICGDFAAQLRKGVQS
ncbi:hypothetical protein M8370_20955 [Enterobacter cloacae complex sp. OE43NF]|uniref:hypothetical protein n=1 Tax=Enterobacter cloacae complex sp. OE43NF TaxID=2945081 RepID=UPI002020B29E|nr:hypothetical protein [Enterobacter cloacae complex sp. OE43NF]MCL7671953.1 hypothetical protein [Enterobacter cloacae complex sp. OE43NF]